MVLSAVVLSAVVAVAVGDFYHRHGADLCLHGQGSTGGSLVRLCDCSDGCDDQGSHMMYSPTWAPGGTGDLMLLAPKMDVCAVIYARDIHNMVDRHMYTRELNNNDFHGCHIHEVRSDQSWWITDPTTNEKYCAAAMPQSSGDIFLEFPNEPSECTKEWQRLFAPTYAHMLV